MGSYPGSSRVPRMRALLATGTLARLPIGINGLAVVLLLQGQRGGFGVAGLAAGALALGTGVGTPLMARAVDRTGPRVLGALALAHAAGLAALPALAASAPPAALVVLAGVTGAVVPPVSSLLRALYPRMLHGELIHGAYALDSVLTELLFVAGPALTAAIAVLVLAGRGAPRVGRGRDDRHVLVPGRAGRRRRPPTPRGRRRGCSAPCARPASGRWS